MRRYVVIAPLLMLGLLLFTGCARGPQQDAWSSDWAHTHHREVEFQRRQQSLRVGEEIVLMEGREEGGARAAVYTDEKGRPKLNLGQPKGLSADVDLDPSDAEFKLKYKREF